MPNNQRLAVQWNEVIATFKALDAANSDNKKECEQELRKKLAAYRLSNIDKPSPNLINSDGDGYLFSALITNDITKLDAKKLESLLNGVDENFPRSLLNALEKTLLALKGLGKTETFNTSEQRDFSYANLAGASLNNLMLDDFNFTSANMVNCNVTHTSFKNANLSHTILDTELTLTTNFDGANITCLSVLGYFKGDNPQQRLPLIKRLFSANDQFYSIKIRHLNQLRNDLSNWQGVPSSAEEDEWQRVCKELKALALQVLERQLQKTKSIEDYLALLKIFTTENFLFLCFIRELNDKRIPLGKPTPEWGRKREYTEEYVYEFTTASYNNAIFKIFMALNKFLTSSVLSELSPTEKSMILNKIENIHLKKALGYNGNFTDSLFQRSALYKTIKAKLNPNAVSLKLEETEELSAFNSKK